MVSQNKLGCYIEKISRKNTDLKYGIDDVFGITNDKLLIPGTKANLIGRTFEKFTILEPGEFIFNRRTSRNGEKISLGYNTNKTCILTEDYCHFKIKSDMENILHPDYLYMFFLNPMFNDYARFNSWGSATEFFNWKDMCDVPIYLPDFEEQKRIVKRYHVLVNKIDILNLKIKKLHEMIDSFYYRLTKNKDKLNHIGDILVENPKSKINVEMVNSVGEYPFFTSGDSILFDSNYIVDGFNLFLNDGGKFDVKFFFGKASYSSHIWSIYGKDNLSYYLYCTIIDNFDRISSDECFRGSAIKNLKKKDMENIEIYLPTNDEILDFNKFVGPLFRLISIYEKETMIFTQIKLYLVSSIYMRK